MGDTLELVLILLASAVLVVVLFRFLHLPALLGYLLVGVAVGPFALAWVPDTEEGRHLAEFGVVFLMFSIGLEFSLAKLFQLRRAVFGLGLSQVTLTLAAVLAAAAFAGASWQAGLAVGGALAMSSTAIVLRILAERIQLETAHGRDIIGVLLFQDLAVVPLLIVIPAIAEGSGELAERLAFALAKAAVVLVVLLFVGQRLMRGWFHIVARSRSHELFILNVLLITLGLAWLTERAGLSLALGAFLAGMLIAETGGHQAVSRGAVGPVLRHHRHEARPRGGRRQLSAGAGADRSAGRVQIRAGRGARAPVRSRSRRGPARRSCSRPGGRIRPGAHRPGAVGCIARARLLPAHRRGDAAVDARRPVHHSGERQARAALVERGMDAAIARAARVAVESLATERHVIVCGYGRTGQRLAHLLEQERIESIALDTDPERVHEAAAAGEKVVYGDASRHETLVAAGVARASALVITFADTPLALRVLHHARALNPALPVIVRTLDDADMDRLIAAGAAEVVPETFESSLMLASHALVLLGVPLRRVVRRIREVREHRYSLMRGFFHGGTDEAEDPDEAREPRLHSVTLAPGAGASGRSLGELRLDELGVRVTALRRRELRMISPGQDVALQEGDVIVLLGTPEQLAAAEMRLLEGWRA